MITLLAADCVAQESTGSDIAVAMIFVAFFALVGYLAWLTVKSS